MKCYWEAWKWEIQIFQTWTWSHKRIVAENKPKAWYLHVYPREHSSLVAQHSSATRLWHRKATIIRNTTTNTLGLIFASRGKNGFGIEVVVVILESDDLRLLLAIFIGFVTMVDDNTLIKLTTLSPEVSSESFECVEEKTLTQHEPRCRRRLVGGSWCEHALLESSHFAL